MALDKVIDSAILDAELLTVADAIRAKGGTSDVLAFPEGFVSAVEAIAAGGGESGGIGAIKFVDEDITVEESTSTAVTYTIDGVQIPTFLDNPNKWGSYTGNEVMICFITPKEITKEYTGSSYVTTSAMFVLYVHTNYGATIMYTGGTSGSVRIKQGWSGFESVDISGTTDVTDGIVTSSVSVKVLTQNSHVVQAGTYNVQFWMLTDFDWGM